LPSYVTNKELALNDPIKLIDFYESRITYCDGEKKENE
jgi:hypothetical protein